MIFTKLGSSVRLLEEVQPPYYLIPAEGQNNMAEA
jgi:hypothetical protein